MDLSERAQRIRASVNDLIVEPVIRVFLGLNPADRTVVYGLVAAAAILGFAFGRLRTLPRGLWRVRSWRLPTFQNEGEALVSRVILKHCAAPYYHLMNHITLRIGDGTTQIDHILVSRFGVFVIETKDYRGWIFANSTQPTWTQVLFRWKVRFQNPILQNYKHVCAVRALLDFLPPEAITSLVVFTDRAEFKTDLPAGVTTISRLPEYLRQQNREVMSHNRQQFCVGRLETARLAVSQQTDLEHVEHLARRYGSSYESVAG